MQGDAYPIKILLKTVDGSVITPADVDDVEIVLGKHRKTYANGVVTYENECWMFPMTQLESLMFRNTVRCQARVKFKNTDVIGVFIDNVDVMESDSKVVL